MGTSEHRLQSDLREALQRMEAARVAAIRGDWVLVQEQPRYRLVPQREGVPPLEVGDTVHVLVAEGSEMIGDATVAAFEGGDKPVLDARLMACAVIDYA